MRSGEPVETLLKTSIEQCGRSRIPLNGMVQRLHQANLFYLYQIKTGHHVVRPQ